MDMLRRHRWQRDRKIVFVERLDRTESKRPNSGNLVGRAIVLVGGGVLVAECTKAVELRTTMEIESTVIGEQSGPRERIARSTLHVGVTGHFDHVGI